MSRNMASCGTKTKAAGCVEQPAAGESSLWQWIHLQYTTEWREKAK